MTGTTGTAHLPITGLLIQPHNLPDRITTVTVHPMGIGGGRAYAEVSATSGPVSAMP
jgi:hypothetical protein